MKTDGRENSIRSRMVAGWEDRWMRFRLALNPQGVEWGVHEFYRGWVLGWMKFIKSRKFGDGNLKDGNLKDLGESQILTIAFLNLNEGG